MKTLVTGGAGFIGSHVADAYIKSGHEVVVVDNLASGSRSQVPSGARFYEVDIRDSKLADVFKNEKPDVVNHHAALANVRESLDQPLLYADVNVLGSLNVLECARRHGVRKVIYAATGGAGYGEPQWLPVTEDHPINPLDPYGASKHHVEHYLYLYHANFDIAYTVLRYPNVYGPRQDPHGEGGVISIFANQMLHEERPVIFGSGEQSRDFLYVGDVARANLLALNEGDGGMYNLGHGVCTSINQVYALLADSTGYTEAPTYRSGRQGEVFSIGLDAGLAARDLKWVPQVSLRDGLAETVAFFQNS